MAGKRCRRMTNVFLAGRPYSFASFRTRHGPTGITSARADAGRDGRRSRAAARPRRYRNVPQGGNTVARVTWSHCAGNFSFHIFPVSREIGRGPSHGPAAGRPAPVDSEFSGLRFRNSGNAFNGPRAPRPAIALGRRAADRRPSTRPAPLGRHV